MSGVDPDPLINLALAIAQRRCAEHPEIAAAYATYDADLANAWKEDPEFGNALHWAVALGDIRPLKQYLCSDKPLSRMNKRALEGRGSLLPFAPFVG